MKDTDRAAIEDIAKKVTDIISSLIEDTEDNSSRSRNTSAHDVEIHHRIYGVFETLRNEELHNQAPVDFSVEYSIGYYPPVRPAQDLEPAVTACSPSTIGSTSTCPNTISGTEGTYIEVTPVDTRTIPDNSYSCPDSLNTSYGISELSSIRSKTSVDLVVDEAIKQADEELWAKAVAEYLKRENVKRKKLKKPSLSRRLRTVRTGKRWIECHREYIRRDPIRVGRVEKRSPTPVADGNRTTTSNNDKH